MEEGWAWVGGCVRQGIIASVDRATEITFISQALSSEPLIDPGDYHRFYGNRFENELSDCTEIMRLELTKSHRGLFYQRFLTGHSGSGKSTELTRLSLVLEDKFEFIRLSALHELSLFTTQPFDLLEVMAIRLVEQAKVLGIELSGAVLQRLHDWFQEVTERKASAISGSVSGEAEAGVSAPSLLQRVLKLGRTVKGEAKFSNSRSVENVRKRLQRLSDLTDLSNEIYDEANRRLNQLNGKDWVFLIEDFDKDLVSGEVLDTLFVKYANTWPKHRMHLVCTIPLWLAFGERVSSLPFKRRTLVDIPVFDRHHRPHEEGRNRLRGILEKRVDHDLFEPNVRDYLIQAAGGNLRDMFAVVTEAANYAEVTRHPRIAMLHAHRAVNWLRNEYINRLGETSAENAIPYEQKADVLVKIYRGTEERVVQDRILYRLLRSRVVNEYNDTYWYGIPPLMVDILIQQGKLEPGSPGGLEPATL